MNEELKNQLREYGALVEETIGRFMGNEKLYEKFMVKFLDDKNYGKLKEHLENADYEEAFKDAHTLKGVAANLGLEPMKEPVVAINELLRNKKDASEIDVDLVKAKMEELTQQYEKCREIIVQLAPDVWGL